MYFVFSLLCLSSGSVIIASGQMQMIDIKVLERGEHGQCSSMEERGRARNEIHQFMGSVVMAIETHLQWYTRMEACCFYQHD